MFFGVGGYCLSSEKTMAIELDMVTRETAYEAALEIGLLNRQEAVLIQELPVVSELVRIPRPFAPETTTRKAWTECLTLIQLSYRSVIGLLRMRID
jgi:hypothetical protein